jgi:hypothetical protein
LLPFLLSFTYAIKFNIMGCGPNYVSEHDQHNMRVHLLLSECHWNLAYLRWWKILQLEGNNNNHDTWRLRCALSGGPWPWEQTTTSRVVVHIRSKSIVHTRRSHQPGSVTVARMHA